MSAPVLEINNLKTHFLTDKEEIPAVNNLSMELQKGEFLGIVGESGSGKSITSLSILNLLPNPGKIVGGEIFYKGNNLLKNKEKEMQKIRGKNISMIFQEPMTSLNPLFTIGEQMIEGLLIHESISKKEAMKEAINYLKLVELPRVEDLINEYPHQLSGGMRQRVMIAMSLICKPDILIADEPTTALDVTIQAQILELIKDLNKKLNTSIIMITHDLGVVANTCERVIVMYAGQVMEQGYVKEIFNNPKHPYTEGLINSIPDIRKKRKRLYSIPGQAIKPSTSSSNCAFSSRCPYAFERCFIEEPQLYTSSCQDTHKYRCFLYDKEDKHDSTFTTD